MNDRPTRSRRDVLRYATACAACALTGDGGSRSTRVAARGPAAGAASEPRPRDAFGGVLNALQRFPLVALGEDHQLQEWHDFVTALLFRPELPDLITDVVVEFGNALHQDVADRFVVEDRPVADAELRRIWRQTIGGGVLWDAPVYAQFFRSVRAVNWMRLPSRRLRVVLGDPPFDHAKARGAADRPGVLATANGRDRHFAAVVKKEVLDKGRRALLLAGTGHVLRGGRVAGHANAVTLLEGEYPGRVFVIVPLRVARPAGHGDGDSDRWRAVARWPRPALAALPGTWLGDTEGYGRNAPTAPGARLGAQADAVLFTGPDEVLTRSCPEPSIYETGDYPRELERLDRIMGPGGHGDAAPNVEPGRPDPRKQCAGRAGS
jgi:hypothetical protein